MNLHEYQGKQLFAQYGLPVSKGIAAPTVEEAVADESATEATSEETETKEEE